jgi:UDP-N-acetyl-2-amino-2-deoxyglucuronate dehydrogenase
MENCPKKAEEGFTDPLAQIIKKPKFAIIGLGFISGKHLDAIDDVGGELIMGCDIDEEKSIKLPSECKFFRYWKNMLDDPLFEKVDYVSICTPNHLHFPMIQAVRDREKEVICEKPLVLRSEQIHELDDKVYTVLQLRYSPLLALMRGCVLSSNLVTMNITVNRGAWYFDSWKNDKEKSGGLCMNIGIHYFDLLILLFGNLIVKDVFISVPDREIGGVFYTNDSFITWKLSLLGKKDNQHRSIVINNMKFNLSRNFESLHTQVYKDIVFSDGGVTPRMVYKTIRLVEMIHTKLKLGEICRNEVAPVF